MKTRLSLRVDYPRSKPGGVGHSRANGGGRVCLPVMMDMNEVLGGLVW